MFISPHTSFEIGEPSEWSDDAADEFIAAALAAFPGSKILGDDNGREADAAVIKGCPQTQKEAQSMSTPRHSGGQLDEEA